MLGFKKHALTGIAAASVFLAGATGAQADTWKYAFE